MNRSWTAAVIAGARPNFPKVAPLLHALALPEYGCRTIFVHTGQHYDAAMSGSFLADLGMPPPCVSLEVGSGSHAAQTGAVMAGFERFVREFSASQRLDMVVVVGDVNSSLGCALVAAKENIPVAHVEAGLRSGDRSMPEEINRVVVDSISSLLLTHSPDADDHLLREGHSPAAIQRVGNLMIDTLARSLPRRQPVPLPEGVDRYAVLTLHRPANVDRLSTFSGLIDACLEIATRRSVSLVLPAHPRVERQLFQLQLSPEQRSRLMVLPPLPYLQFISLLVECEFVLTDSGGIQEETSFLGTPCFTLRDNTERPITISHGTNTLVGTDPDAIPDRVVHSLARARTDEPRIPGWDGHAAERAAAAMRDFVIGKPVYEPVLAAVH